MRQALDYSSGVPTGVAVKAAGYAGVFRYLKKTGASSVHTLSACIYEDTSPARMLAGRNAGANDALWAYGQAQKCGITDPRCIYFTADFDVQPAQFAAVDAYLDGASSAIGAAKVGLYGGYNMIRHAQGNGKAKWLWQTMAWSHGQVAPSINAVQRIQQATVDSVVCDVSDLLALDWGQHPAPNTSKPGDPVTETEMDHLVDKILNALDKAGDDTLAGSVTRGTKFIDAVAKRVKAFAANPNA